jgi:hypothetical protein
MPRRPLRSPHLRPHRPHLRLLLQQGWRAPRPGRQQEGPPWTASQAGRENRAWPVRWAPRNRPRPLRSLPGSTRQQPCQPKAASTGRRGRLLRRAHRGLGTHQKSRLETYPLLEGLHHREVEGSHRKVVEGWAERPDPDQERAQGWGRGCRIRHLRHAPRQHRRQLQQRLPQQPLRRSSPHRGPACRHRTSERERSGCPHRGLRRRAWPAGWSPQSRVRLRLRDRPRPSGRRRRRSLQARGSQPGHPPERGWRGCSGPVRPPLSGPGGRPFGGRLCAGRDRRRISAGAAEPEVSSEPHPWGALRTAANGAPSAQGKPSCPLQGVPTRWHPGPICLQRGAPGRPTDQRSGWPTAGRVGSPEGGRGHATDLGGPCPAFRGPLLPLPDFSVFRGRYLRGFLHRA